MGHKPQLPGDRGILILFVLAVLFAGITAVFRPLLGAAEGLVTLVLFLILWRRRVRSGAFFREYIVERSGDIMAAARGTIVNAPLPLVLFEPESGEIIWSNEQFLGLTGNPNSRFHTKLSQAVPAFSTRWVQEGHSVCPDLVPADGKLYRVFGNLIDANHGGNSLAVSYWVDETRAAMTEARYLETRPVAAIILLDNYEDLMRGVDESERSVLLGDINRRIRQWAEPVRGILCRYDREHHLLLFEERHLPELVRLKFSILEGIRAVRSPNAITATISIGLAKDAGDFRELFQLAVQAMETALSRGGDQAVLRERDGVSFFGGRAKEAERRSTVKGRVMANTLRQLLDRTSRIFLMGHSFPDLDVLGAEAGLVAIARKFEIPVFILTDGGANPAAEMLAQLAALPEYEDVFTDGGEAAALADEKSLLIVADTNRPEQTQFPALLTEIPRVVVIDHHRRGGTHIEGAALSYEDPFASSASELVVELMQYLVEPGDLLRQEAEAVLAGIVLDTKNFSLRTGGRTFEAAAYLRRVGADTGEVRKLFQSDLSGTRARNEITHSAEMLPHNIAFAVAADLTDRVVAAKAADDLLAIRGVEASFVLFPFGEKRVGLSGRSTGNVNVQLICEALGGGGNAAAAAAQWKDVTLAEAQDRFRAAVAAYFKNA